MVTAKRVEIEVGEGMTFLFDVGVTDGEGRYGLTNQLIWASRVDHLPTEGEPHYGPFWSFWNGCVDEVINTLINEHGVYEVKPRLYWGCKFRGRKPTP